MQNLSSNNAEIYVEDIEDEEPEGAASALSYDIMSYGADPEVESLVNRLNRGDIFIPSFQREYVWTISQASRFVESLLLGLPVPGIFLAQDDQNKQLVIDGQQRLKSLQFFYDGQFAPKGGNSSSRSFKLTGVQPVWEGKGYCDLDDRDKNRLDTSIIHATVVKQIAPSGDDTSMFHVFERLNTGGSKLSDQEIRVALYHGSLLDFISQINDSVAWRELYGPKSSRLKDQELILRFYALRENANQYSKPMKDFINKFCGSHQNRSDFLEHARVFRETTELILHSIGRKAFRPETNFNAAAFDSIMVGVARRLDQSNTIPTDQSMKDAYDKLMGNEAYREAISKATSDGKQVEIRIALATEYFMGA